jgi:hypothetical protein
MYLAKILAEGKLHLPSNFQLLNFYQSGFLNYKLNYSNNEALTFFFHFSFIIHIALTVLKTCI